MGHNREGEAVCRVGNSQEEFAPPEGTDLEGDQGNDWEVDEPYKSGGAEVEEKVEFVGSVLVVHGVLELV